MENIEERTRTIRQQLSHYFLKITIHYSCSYRSYVIDVGLHLEKIQHLIFNKNMFIAYYFDRKIITPMENGRDSFRMSMIKISIHQIDFHCLQLFLFQMKNSKEEKSIHF